MSRGFMVHDKCNFIYAYKKSGLFCCRFSRKLNNVVCRSHIPNFIQVGRQMRVNTDRNLLQGCSSNPLLFNEVALKSVIGILLKSINMCANRFLCALRLSMSVIEPTVLKHTITTCQELLYQIVKIRRTV
jgi:hypothetical protein